MNALNRFRAFVVTVAIVTFHALVASGDPLPSFVPSPPGVTLGATRYHRFDSIDVGIPPGPDSPQWQHLQPAGHYWSVTVTTVPAGYQLASWRPALEHAGWRIVSDSPVLIAQHDSPTGRVWLKQTQPYSYEVLAVTPAQTLVLPAPGATPEQPVDGQSLPYLPPLPGLTLSHFAVQDHGEEMTGPLTGGPFYASPPVWRFEYTAPNDLSGLEVQTVYSAAFAAAGWTINGTSRGGATTAHYAQHGRDLWAKVLGNDHVLNIIVADLGAAAAAARLRAALQQNGHVALYGIYFDTDRDVLRPDSDATLQQILALLRETPSLRLEVQGHTDNTGAADHNQTLSNGRAGAVRQWLVQHGIAASRLTAAGFADRQPVADNHTDQGRALNRRVELRRLDH